MPRPRRGAAAASNKKTVSVNFAGTEGRVLLPEGDYLAKVESVEQFESQAGNPTLKWVFMTIDDDKKYNNKPLYVNTSLMPQALWNLRNLLEALGIDIPDDEFDLDLEEPVGKEVVLSVDNEEYEGRKVSRVTDYSPAEEAEESNPSGKSASKETTTNRTKKPEPEVEKIDPADVRNMDVDQLGELIEEHELDVNLKEHVTLRRKVNAVIDALEAKDLLGDE